MDPAGKLRAHRSRGGWFRRQPAAPFERDPTQWPSLPWYDRATGQPIDVAAESSLLGEYVDRLATGTVPIQTIGEVIRRYRLRPEHKSLEPDGTPARRDTIGSLTRRPIESTLVLQTLSGKEGNKLLERLSPTAALVGVGILLVVATLLAIRRLIVIDRGARVPIVEISLLRSIPLFHALPPPAIEGIAHALQPFDAGSRKWSPCRGG